MGQEYYRNSSRTEGDELINIIMNIKVNIEKGEVGIVLERGGYVRVNREPGWTSGVL